MFKYSQGYISNLVSLYTVANNSLSLHISAYLIFLTVWRRLHGSRGHVPPLLQMAAHGGGAPRVEEQQKINSTDHYESAHQND